MSRPLAYAVKVFADEGVVQWPCDSVNVKAEESEHIAHNLEVAVMAGDHDKAFVFLHEPLGVFGVFESRVFSPVVFFDQSRRKNNIDSEHCDLLETSFAGPADPFVAFIRVTRPQVVDSPLSTPVIVLPEHSTEKTSEFKVGIDGEEIQQQNQQPKCQVGQIVGK